jgi:hypothetical protein
VKQKLCDDSAMTVSLLNDDALRHLAQPPSTGPCVCAVGACAAWESFTEDRWPAAQMHALGTLRDPGIYEPTFEEQHPSGTRYDSVDAPISAKHFPFNRCDVFRCSPCGRALMRYTEFGGYYVDHRVRELRADLVVKPDSL